MLQREEYNLASAGRTGLQFTMRWVCKVDISNVSQTLI